MFMFPFLSIDKYILNTVNLYWILINTLYYNEKTGKKEEILWPWFLVEVDIVPATAWIPDAPPIPAHTKKIPYNFFKVFI